MFHHRPDATLATDIGSMRRIMPYVSPRRNDSAFYLPQEMEVEAILKIADGIGASALSDWDADDLRSLAGMAKAKGKLFALHASEAVREDIATILALKPDFLRTL